MLHYFLLFIVYNDILYNNIQILLFNENYSMPKILILIVINHLQCTHICHLLHYV